MNKKTRTNLTFIIIMTLIIFSLTNVYAAQPNKPSQQSNKIILTPFYVPSMIQNTNYTYSVDVITPDGISKIKTAIITLDAWINPTRTFNAYVNNVQCNTKNYTISTTYASAGRGVVTFDCSNAIKPNQINTVKLMVTGGSIGASTSWLDLTYMNNPLGEVTVHGTEYNNEQDAKVWLQLIDNNGDHVLNGTCFVDIYTPSNEEYVELASMTNLLHDGVYYYDFDAPSIEGVYPVIAKCYYGSQEVKYYVYNYTILIGKNNRTIASDDFECNAFTCGSGWNAIWSYTGSCAIVTSPTIGSYALRGQTACDATRRFDNTDYTNTTISFYATATSLEAGEYCRYYYYDGSTYNQLLSLTDGSDDGIYDYYTYDVTSYSKSSNAGIRMTGGPFSGDYCYIDNITINGRINQTISDLDVIDGLYFGIIENNISGNNRLLNATFDVNTSGCNAVSESLLTGVNIQVYSKFDSVPNDDITVNVYNWTSNNWITLPNKLLEGSFHATSNVILLNNLTTAGLYNGSVGVRVRLNDTNYTDTTESVLLIDQLYVGCEQADDAIWQEVKGSSEVHVTADKDAYPFVPSTLCGEESTSSSCAEFVHDEEYWNYTWGHIYDNISIINSYQSDISSVFYYETWQGVDCTALIDVVENGVTSISDIVELKAGAKENCIVGIPVILDAGDREVFYELTFDNFMKWDVMRMNDYAQYFYLVANPFCQQISTMNNNPYDIPIQAEDVSTLYADNPVYLGCYHTLDDFYWFNSYYNDSLTVNTAGEYESYFLEIAFYYPELKDHATIIKDFGDDYSFMIHVQDLCDAEDISHGSHNYTSIVNEEMSGTCAKLMPMDSYFPYLEGWIQENLTVTNTFSSHVHSNIIYETVNGLDCTGVLDVIEVRGNSTLSILNITLMKLLDGDKCYMNIPVMFNDDEGNYSILINMQNYQRWDYLNTVDTINFWNETIVLFCDDLATNNNFTYEVPRITPLNGSSDFNYCNNALDTLYWWYDFYALEQAENITMIGEFGGYWYESNFYFPRVKNDYDTITSYSRNINQVLTLALTQDILNNTASRVWNYSSRNLTYYPDANINTSGLATAVWNETNRTLTYYPAQTDMTNYTLISDTVWNYTGVISNSLLSQVTTALWSYVARYTHGVILN